MAVHYVVQQKRNPGDEAAPKKYYLVAKSLPAVSRKVFINDMVRNTSLTSNEAATALDYLFDVLPHYLALGHTVQLGELGYFRVTLKSEGSENPEEATPDKIKGKKLRFVCGSKIRTEISNLQVEKFPV
ncbi:putative histone-like DNA-binding protein [Dysgonomonadaceae bacterium PH5-43]|nr:putative histone-like DNA-binding protein [Dysgonomonadaceae bacterium PH5-43]